MSHKFIINKISKKEFLKIDEDDVMFITNPGRMGDEDSSTFIIKNMNEFKIYRLSGWMYPDKDIDKKQYISFNDALKQFPKWHEMWDNNTNKNYQGKYKYLYMGFGNGLSIDNRIYDEFKPYLDKKVKECLEGEEDKDSLLYSAIFNTWEDAFIDMVNNKL